MSLSTYLGDPANRNNFALATRIPSLLQGARDFITFAESATDLGKATGNAARRIVKSNQKSQTTLERKMAPKNSAVTGNKGLRPQLGDTSRATSGGGMQQRSHTSSREISISNGGKNKNNKNRNRSRIARSPYTDSWTIQFRGVMGVINNAVNVSSGQMVGAINQSLFAGAQTFGTIIPQSLALGTMFREFRVKKIGIDFIPRVGSTSTGSIGVCWDRDPRAGTVTSITTIVRKNPFFEVDIKQPGDCTWLPTDEEDRRWRYSVDGSRPQENLSIGSLLWYSQNDLALNAYVGDLFLDVVFDFAVPY